MPNRSRRYPIATATVGVMAALLLASHHCQLWFDLGKGIRVRQLRESPVGATVHLHGVVTYADSAGKQFWIQDETGAIGIKEDPRSYGIHAGQSIHIEATKTRPYDPMVGTTSVGLKALKVTSSHLDSKLPLPAMAPLRTLSGPEKDGIQIQVSGVVRRVTRDEVGRMELAIGDSGQEVRVTLAEANGALPQWVDAEVRIVGIRASVSKRRRGKLGKTDLGAEQS